MSVVRRGVVMLGLGSVALAAFAVAPRPERGGAMVAADHVLASEAGAEVLRRGGNAVDAAVAAALAAGVVQPAGSGLGGGGFAVGRVAGEKAFALDFREVAPEAAGEGFFRGPDGAVVPGWSTDGGRAVAVPSEGRGLALLVKEHGASSLAEVAAPAIRLAAGGFEVGPHLADALSASKYPAVRTVFGVGDHLARAGEIVRRPALARTLQRWARSGGQSLNEGPDAAAIVRAASAEGGVLTVADLAAVAPKPREPLVGQFRGYTVVTMPPPSSGGVALLEALEVLEGYDLPSLGHSSADHLHLLVEVMGHVYADRAHHLGDPDFVDVPTERLLSEARADEIRRAIWPGRTFGLEHYGPLIAPPTDAGTQHISAMDDRGGAVALTTTINNSFGSGTLVPELGIFLNDEMDDFAAAPGVPNAFGLVGAAANAIAPKKRPLSSMTPTLVLDEEGKVVLVVGASGGSTIISGTLQVLLNVLVFGLDAEEAVAAPRVHHQWVPRGVWAEPGIAPEVLGALKTRGHALDPVRELFTAVQVVTARDGAVEGASDPRKGGRPATP